MLNDGVIIHFWIPTKKKYTKSKKIYIFKRKQKNNSSENRMLKHPKNSQSWLRKLKNLKKKLKFDNIFLTNKGLIDKKKIQFEKEKSKIRCLRNQLDFIERLIKFMKVRL